MKKSTRKTLIVSLLTAMVLTLAPAVSMPAYAEENADDKTAEVAESLAEVSELMAGSKEGKRYPTDEEIEQIVLEYWATIGGAKGKYWNAFGKDAAYWTELHSSYSELKASDALLAMTNSGLKKDLAATVTDEPCVQEPGEDDDDISNCFRGACGLSPYDTWDSGFASYMLYLIYGSQDSRDFEKFEQYDEESGEPQPGDYIRCIYNSGDAEQDHSYVIYKIIGRMAYIIEADVPFGSGHVNRCTRLVDDVKADVNNYFVEDKNGERVEEENEGYLLRIKPAEIYTVEYMPNHGSGSMEPSEFLREKEYELSENSFVRSGYVFSGWNTKPDRSGRSFENMERVSKLAHAGETVTLYAQWKEKASVEITPETYMKSCSYYPTCALISAVSDGVEIMNMPCFAEDNENAIVAETAASGDVLTAVELTRNYDNEYWYSVELADGTEGYVYAGNVNYLGPTEDAVEFVGTDITADIVEGKSIDLPGSINGKHGITIINVRASVSSLTVDPATGEYVKDGAASASEEYIESSSFKLRDSTLDKRINLSKLPVGEAAYILGVDYMLYYSPDGRTLATDNCTLSHNTVFNVVAEYRIRYHANKSGATGYMEDSAHCTGVQKKLSRNGFSCKGYKFECWTTAADGSGDKYENRELVLNLSDKTNTVIDLYAQWTPITYYVEFYGNYGKGYMDPQECQYDTETTLHENTFTRRGYTFAKWNTKEDGSGSSYADGAKIKNLRDKDNSVFELYAQWKTNKYTIRFDANGGTGYAGSMSCEYDKEYELRMNTFRYEHHTFLGWSTDPNERRVSKLYKDKQVVKNLIPDADGEVLLYAIWRENEQCTITYKSNTENPDDVTDLPEAQTGEETTELRLSSSVPTRPGYHFIKWSEDKNGGEPSYRPGESLVLTKNIDLYAIWEANVYSVEFRGNSGSGSMSGISSCTYDVSFTLPENRFTKTNYAFVGWNTEEDGSGISCGDRETVKNLTTENHVTVYLYAQWQCRDMVITYDANGGENAPANQNVRYGEVFNIPAQVPTRSYVSVPYTGGSSADAAYTFLGWSDDPDATEAKYSRYDECTFYSDTTLYAVWKQEFNTLSFYVADRGCNDITAALEEGTAALYSYATADSNKTLGELGWVIPNAASWPSSDGDKSKFVGWFTEENGKGEKIALNASTLIDHSFGPLYPFWEAPKKSALLSSEPKPERDPNAPITFIESVELELATPAVWEEISTDTAVQSEGCSVETSWLLASDGSRADGRIAQYETSYKAVISLSAEDGYIFKNNETIPALVNGVETEARVLSTGEAQIEFAYRTENEQESAAVMEEEPGGSALPNKTETNPRERLPENSGSAETAGVSTGSGSGSAANALAVSAEDTLRAALASGISPVRISEDMELTQDLLIPAVNGVGTDVYIDANVTVCSDVTVENYGCLHLMENGSLTLQARSKLYLDESTVSTPIQMLLEGGQLWGRSDSIINLGRITIDADAYRRNDFYSLSTFIGKKDLTVNVSLYPSDVISFIKESADYRKIAVCVIGRDSWELNEDFIIPENCQISFDGVSSFSVADGATLTNFGSLLLRFGGSDTMLEISPDATFHNFGYIDSPANILYR